MGNLDSSAGRALFGGSSNKRYDLLTDTQKRGLESTYGLQPTAVQAAQQFLNPEDYSATFQKSVIDPTMLTYQKQILPMLNQQYSDLNASSSSALNNALADSAADVQTMLGQQYANFYNQQQQNKLAVLNPLISSYMNPAKTYENVISKQQGVIPAFFQGLGGLAGRAITGG